MSAKPAPPKRPQNHQELSEKLSENHHNALAESKMMGRVIHMNEVLEAFIAVVVVILLFISAILVLWTSSVDLYQALIVRQSFDIPYVIRLLSSIMLALVLAEIIATVNAFLKEGIFSPVPFLVVAVIASVRRILLISIENKGQVGAGAEISTGLMIELGLLAVIIGICSWAIGALRRANIKLFSASQTGSQDNP